MKIIVCGAGSVGRSIVGYLIQGNNDIIVIDTDQKKLDDLSKEWDVQPVIGSSSHPQILEKAGAEGADLIIAATNFDEVNMVTCQLAHSLFNIPQKIARIDALEFTNPMYSYLYNDNHIPVDRIISPEIAIAKAIYSLLKFPGSSDVISLLDNKVCLLSFTCTETCPFLETKIMELERVAPHLDISIISIIRNNKSFIPNNKDKIQLGDKIYFLVETEKAEETIQDFGFSMPSNENVIIFGANQVSYYLAQFLEKDDNILLAKIIDDDVSWTKKLAEDLSETVVLKGEMMSDVILNEANIENADVSIAVTAKDKDNLLASMLARKRSVRSTISLVNSRSYNNLIDSVGDNILVDRSSVTISSILKELRKSKIVEAYSLGKGFGEVWELKIEDQSPHVGKAIKNMDIHKESKICAIERNEKIIFPEENEVLQKDDSIILFVSIQAIRKAETIFA